MLSVERGALRPVISRKPGQPVQLCLIASFSSDRHGGLHRRRARLAAICRSAKRGMTVSEHDSGGHSSVGLRDIAAQMPGVLADVPVMVRGVSNVPAVSKTTKLSDGLAIFAGLALVLTLAQPMPARSVPTSYESSALVTRYDELSS